MTQIHYAPITVPCPFCHAQPDAYCVSSGGWTMAGFHAGRSKAVAHLTDGEKAAALKAMQDERDQHRREADEYMRALEADPAYVARRNEASAAFAEMNAQMRLDERAARLRCESPFYHPADCRCLEPGWVRSAPRVVPVGVLPVADLMAEKVRRR